ERLVYRLAVNYPRGLALQRHFKCFPLDGAFAVNGIAKRIHHTAYDAFANLNGSDEASTFYGIAFFDTADRAEQYSAHIVFFKVEGDSLQPVVEFDHLAGLYIAQTVYAGNTVTHLQYGT